MKKGQVIAVLLTLLISGFVYAQNQTQTETNITLVNISDIDEQPNETIEEDNVTPEENITEEVTIEEEQEANVTPEESVTEEVTIEEPSENQTQIISPPSFGLVRRFRSLANLILAKLMSGARWLITRDYVSAAKNFVWFVLGLELWIKAIMIALIFLVLLIIWAFYFRDTRANNLRRARRLHRKGQKEHKAGNEELAQIYYMRAAEYREKAQDQW